MSSLSTVENLKCIKCPFFEAQEYKCFLDQNVKIEDENSFPPYCPMLDGKVVTIKVRNGKLIIGRDYE